MTSQFYPYNPDYAVPPGWVLEERLETQGISPEQLAENCGLSIQQVRGIIAGEVPVGPEIADHLERVLGLSADIWLGIESDYRASLANLRS